MQVLVNSIVAGSGIALIAVGFGLIYSTCRFFHFAHGAVYMVGGYVAYALIVLAGCSLGPAIPLAITTAAVCGCLMEVCFYRPLRKRGASSIVLLLVSLGLFVALQNLISLCFGDATLILRTGEPKLGLKILGAHITPVQIGLIVMSVVLGSGSWGALRFTRVGRIVRAVSNDAGLASVVGISVDRSVLCVFGAGSALAAVASIMMAYDTDLNPMMGFHALLLGVVATIVGGVGSISGAFLGGLLVGAAQQFGVWRLPTQWQDAIAFVILLVFLLVRPQGFLGRPLRQVAV